MENLITRSKKAEGSANTVKIKVIPTEIYSRVVGYFRPVQNWNKGKVEEFGDRCVIDPAAAVK